MGVVTSLGVEIEFQETTQDALYDFIERKKIAAQVITDASCTSNRLVLGKIPVTAEQLLNNPARDWARTVYTGGEFVSNIILSDQVDRKWFQPLSQVISFLTDNGEKPSLVSGIHVHMNVGGIKNVNIDFLKAVLKLWRKTEAAWYRLTSGEMGYSRGAEQLSYCYYRPLVSKYGPAVVEDRNGRRMPCFDIDKVLRSRDLDDFFQALGRSDVARGHGRWATKYHGLNLMSIMTKGTIELRTPNFTNRPDYLYAWIRSMQTMLWLAMADSVHPVKTEDYRDLPLGYDGDFSLSDFLRIIPIQESEVIHSLEDIWNKSTWSPDVKGYQWSHLGHGLGRNMQASVMDWTNVRNDLIPTPLAPDLVIHRPEEFASDLTVTSLRENVPEIAELPRIRNQVRATIGDTFPAPFRAMPTARFVLDDNGQMTLRAVDTATTIN